MLIAQLSASHLLLAALLTCVVFILYRAQRKFGLPAADSPAARFTPPAAATMSSRQHADWTREMEHVAQEITTRIDSKLAALEQLTRLAQHESKRLEAALARSQDAASGEESAREPASVEALAPVHQARRLEEQVRHQPHTAAGAVQRPIAAPDRPYARIYAMADVGHDAQTISQLVELPVGEVELILGLRSKA